MKTVLVAAVALIDPDGRVLLAQRPTGKSMAGLWEFPGGKVRENESDFDAVRRELSEELNVRTIEVGETLFEVPDPGSDFIVVFKDVRIIGEPQALEHSELCWATPLELINYRLAPSDEISSRIVLARSSVTSCADRQLAKLSA